jgi:hypothetical protein
MGKGRADVLGMALVKSSNDAIRFYACSHLFCMTSLSGMLHTNGGKMAAEQHQAIQSL